MSGNAYQQFVATRGLGAEFYYPMLVTPKREPKNKNLGRVRQNVLALLGPV